MRLAFTSVLFRHNSTCVIQKWLRFERVKKSKINKSKIKDPK